MESTLFDLTSLGGYIGTSMPVENVIEAPAELEMPDLKTNEERLNFYKKLLESGEIINIVFTNQERDLGIWKRDGNLTIRLENKELGGSYSNYLKKTALKRKFAVKIVSIDEETNTVYASYNEAKKEQRAEIVKKINQALDAHQLVIVPAIVAGFSREEGHKPCYLDIMGVGITGVLDANQWGYEYFDSFSEVTHIGDIINVKIQRQTPYSTEAEPYFYCSRKAAVYYRGENDDKKWKNVEEIFKLHSKIIIHCVKVYDRSFLGVVVGNYDHHWTAYCIWPTDQDRIKIIKGGYYQGFVKTVSSEKRVLRVKVTDRIPEDVAKALVDQN